jgi:hypothetical protein
MIRRPDGTPYQLKGSLGHFDPQSPAHDLFNRYDEEIIRIGGTPIYYYEVMIQMQTVDPTYMEDRGKLFSPCAVELYAYYEPPQQQNMSGIMGLDTPDEEILLELNYKATLRAIGHPPKIGSRIYTPHRGENWEILDTKLDQFKMWGAIRLQIYCRKFQENPTDGTSIGSQPQPDFKITDL